MSLYPLAIYLIRFGYNSFIYNFNNKISLRINISKYRLCFCFRFLGRKGFSFLQFSKLKYKSKTRKAS